MEKEVVTKISEPIRVLASFSAQKIRLHFFNWQERIYKVESVNLFHIERNENQKLYHFAVTSAGNAYELTYNPVTLEWRLEDATEV